MVVMQVNEQAIRDVVEQVLARIQLPPPAEKSAQRSNSDSGCDGQKQQPCDCENRQHEGRNGLFANVDEAVSAASAAFEQLSKRPIEDRKRIIAHIRRVSIDQCVELGTMEMEETQIGRLQHKIEKLKTLGERTPGVEFLNSQVYSGDHGLAVIEHAPFGVIGVITPVTHSLPTITGNAVSMIAGGNTLVVNPHPSGRRVAAEGVRRFNRAIHQDLGIDNLICVITEPTLETAAAIFSHPGVKLICVTGGPAVARAALNSGKRAIVAGPGNPPVVVDETADLPRAAQAMIQGASYDNNLLCIAEKEVFVVDAIFDKLLQEMKQAGAVQLTSGEIDKLTSKAITTVGEGADRHQVPAKELLGKDAHVLAAAIGKQVPRETELLFGEVPESNPFVPVEQMMPFLPFVRCHNADEAIDKARQYEHGFRHTAIIHSNNVRNMTHMGRVMDTTLFVKNGPCMSALGLGGEGYLSFSIATPTGEGVTSPLTFTRERRCSLIDDLCILGK
jgi:aldehyde dehydrogenase